jgi:dynein heavy chain
MEDANQEEEITAGLAAKANEIQIQADGELSEALPAMQAAKAAVDCLTKNSITEMKSLANPPKEVVEVTKAVLIMRGEKRNHAWNNGQKMMNQPQRFMDELLEYNKEEIDDWIVNDLKPILAQPYFNEVEMRGKSVAASYICAWVVNVIKYNSVYKKVKPLMETLESAKNEVETKTAELSVVRARVKEANDKVAAMNKELDEATELKERVESEADVCLTKLSMAERLVNGLADENTRWGANVQQLKIDAETTTGDTLLAGAFVSYIGPFSARIRNQLWADTWLPDIKNKQIPFTEGVDPLKVLASDADEAHWKNEGLPADRMSLENAGIITSCSRWPLIIDPQLQGSGWIRGKEGEDLEVLQLTQDRWLKRLQNCIQLGKVLLIENVGQDLDATLDPVLQRAIIRKGRNSLFIKLGADEVEYDMTFKLYLMTKLANPHYRPEIAAQCTIINFIVTESGLEDQLLAMVVNVEKPELEAIKTELVRKQNDFKVTLVRLEDELLNALTEADQTTILENTALIEGLELTKQTAEDIKLQTIEAQENEVKINTAREVYRRVAAEGAMIYFLIIALCIVNPLYQYSLESFNTFFFKAIERTAAFEDTEQRVLTLRENIRQTIYQWISRGLFERHKIIFLTQITLRLM